jgi:WD40 repeat protein/DNA-binding SARP family transcriptional activator/energy-coupling factor transporter ATP-binding protein EcfA2
VRYAVLGPLEVHNGDLLVRLPGRKERTLLAALLAAPGGWASTATLTASLWDDPPATAARSLQAHVTRLRRVLETDSSSSGPQAIHTVPGGWRLEVPDEDVDSRRFEVLAADSRTALQRGQWMSAATLAEDALALWRADAYPEFRDVPVCATEAARLAELRSAVQEVAVDAALALGGAAELVGPLDQALLEDPLRERVWSQLMVALYRSGRPADALAAYQRARTVLRDELGVDPGDELRAVHAAVLERDPRLTAPAYAALNGIRSAQGPPIRNPFRGLLPYTEDDAGLLLGRERVLGQLLARLANAAAVCVVGPSGCGKSSLVRAGLIPAVEAGAVPGIARKRTTTLTLRGGEPERIPARGDIDLLVVDQLEELVTATAAERQEAVVAELVAHADAGTRLVFTVRSDLWASCAAVPRLGELLTTSTLLVGPLSDDEVQLVVREGARRGGVLAVDDDLVDAVVEDVRGRDGALPLLSTALARTWERRESGRLTLEAYRAAGGVAGAVAAAAEEAWTGLSDAERTSAKRQLLRLAADGPGGPIRRRAARAELVPDGDPAAATSLEALVTARLVVSDDDGVEVSHEALFTAWPRLAEWLADDAAGRRVRARLTPAALEWATQGRPESELLRGPRLVEALDWADGQEGLLPAETEYLAASSAARDAEATRQRRNTRRLRTMLVAVSAALVVALAAAGVALVSRQRADRAATTATAHRVSQQALLEPRPDLSLLLAAQAVRLSRDPDTEGALLTTLTRSARLLKVAHLPNRPEFLTLSKDGRTLAVSDNQGTVRLYDATTLTLLRSVIAPSTLPIYGLAFVGDDRRLVTAENLPTGSQIAVHDVATQQLLGATAVPDAWNLTATADGTRVAVGSGAGTWLWSAGSPAKILTSNGMPSQFTSDGQRLSVTDPEGGTTFFDVTSGEALRSLPNARGTMSALARDGHILVTSQAGGGLSVWDVESGVVVAQLAGHSGEISQLVLDDTGHVLLSADSHGTVIAWDLPSGRQRQRLEVGSGIASVALASDGGTAYTVDQDGTLASWDLTGHRGFGLTADLPAQPNPPQDAAAFSPDGHWFVFADGDDLVVADGATLVERRRLRLPGSGLAIAIDPAGQRAAIRTADRLVMVDLDVGIIGSSRDVPVGAGDEVVGGVAWSLDGQSVAVVDVPDQQLLVLAAGDLSELRELRLPHSPGRVVAAPDGSGLAVGLGGGKVSVVDLKADGVRTFTVSADVGDAPALAYVGPDLLAVGGRDGNVGFWDVSTGQQRSATIPAVAGAVSALDVASQTGSLVVSGNDGNVRLVDIPTEAPVGTGPGTPTGDAVLALADPARPRLVLLPAGFAPSVWDIDRPTWTTRACNLVGRTLDQDEWRRLVGDEPYAPVCGG